MELDPIWVEYGFTPTESVPLTPVLHRDPSTGERMLQENKHIVSFDNLFTTIRLLETLRELGIGAAGTVRTMRTKREEEWDAEEGAVFLLHREDSVAIGSHSQDLLQHQTQASVVEAYNSQSKSTGFSQSKSMPLSEQRRHAKGRTLRGYCTRETFSERLMDIKSTHTNRVLWGTQYWELSAKKSVIQLAWKDAQIVLFASTVALPHEQVSRLRKRPAKTATGANITRKVFGDQPVKFLPIPTIVDDYNHSMGAVDQAVQLMTTYDTQRVKRKTWKPLFFFLLNLAVKNSFLLSKQRACDADHAHKQFIQDLISFLFDASQKTFRGPNLAVRRSSTPQPPASDLPHSYPRVPFSAEELVLSPDSTIQIPETVVPQFGKRIEQVMHKHELVKLFPIAKSCQSCRLACKPRAYLSRQHSKAPVLPRLPRSYYGCRACREAICLKKESCWVEHIRRARLAESRKDFVRSEKIK